MLGISTRQSAHLAKIAPGVACDSFRWSIIAQVTWEEPYGLFGVFRYIFGLYPSFREMDVGIEILSVSTQVSTSSNQERSLKLSADSRIQRIKANPATARALVPLEMTHEAESPGQWANLVWKGKHQSQVCIQVNTVNCMSCSIVSHVLNHRSIDCLCLH